MIALSCPSLLHRPHAIQLGTAFASAFAGRSAGLGMGEVVLFRAMQHSLAAVASHPNIVVEEYHGAGHQVRFTGSGTYSRTNARCELSDLLVIVYDRKTRDARLSYIQAKSERNVPANSAGVAGQPLVANLEQWDLLARRPSIAPAPGPWGRPSTFNPPPDLLSSALLPSIGSFVFFLHGPNGVEVYYAAASMLTPPRSYRTSSGRLLPVGDLCSCGPAPECLSIYGNAAFGSFLFGLMIGTPVLTQGRPTTPSACSWLAAQLRGFARAAVPPTVPTELAGELADLLDPERLPPEPEPNVGAKSLVIFGVGPGDRRRG